MQESAPDRTRFRGWVSAGLGMAVFLRQAPVIVSLIQAALYYNLSRKGALIGSMYNGWVVTLGGLSIISGAAMITGRRRAEALTAVAGGAILMNAGYHLVRFGPGWVEFMQDYWIRGRFLFAISRFGQDLVLGIWWVYCLWALLIHPPAATPELGPRERRNLRLLAAGAAVCCFLANQAIYRWVPEA